MKFWSNDRKSNIITTYRNRKREEGSDVTQTGRGRVVALARESAADDQLCSNANRPR